MTYLLPLLLLLLAVAATLLLAMQHSRLARVRLDRPPSIPDTPDRLDVLGIDDVSRMPGGTLRALADRIDVPVIVRFRVPPPWDDDIDAWVRSLDWSAQPFTETEVRHMWRCYTRDYWSGKPPDKGIPVDDADVARMRQIISEFVAGRADACLTDGTWMRESIAFSHYIARRWLLDHPALAPLFARRSHPRGSCLLDLEADSDDAYTNPKVWFNGAGYCTGTHHDPVDNLSINVSGHKRWILASPRHRDAFYPYDQRQSTGVLRYHVRNPYTDAGAVDASGAPLYPLLAGARMLEVDVRSGDILVVPKGWIHFVVTMEPSVTITVNLANGRQRHGDRRRRPA